MTVKENARIRLRHIKGTSKFGGCQCFKDCGCKDDFIPVDFEYWIVTKKFNQPKTSLHNDIESAYDKIRYLKAIPINYYMKSYKPEGWRGNVK